jgi:hypothetical protein
MPMTEAEWLACKDPTPMLKFLRGKVSERKLRLFACGCCRLVWYLLTDERSRKVVEIVEMSGEMAIDKRALSNARKDARIRTDELYQELFIRQQNDSAREAVRLEHMASIVPNCAIGPMAASTVATLISEQTASVLRVAGPAANLSTLEGRAIFERPCRCLCALLRDIFGNPFRPSPPLPPAVLSWNDGTVRRIAEGVYMERRMPDGTLDTVRLAILADALLDAGCDSEELIQHCRSAGPHVRGCWAVDLILGKG